MTIICSADYCTGCSACANSCPVDAVSMKPNSEGFLYPHIDQALCMECGICQNTCPVNHPISKHEPGQVYAFISHNKEKLWKSASGGAFFEFASTVLAKGGVAYGARYDDNLYVIHDRAANIDDLNPLLSTKYVQSDLKSVFKQVKADLAEGKTVLFSGTGCQVAGLYGFLGEDPQNLVTVDLLCKGVPSPGVFKKYIEYLTEKYGDSISAFDFRSKKFGWGRLVCTVTTASGETIVLNRINGSFIKTAGAGFVRKSCFHCPYTSRERISDITLGDFWHIGEKEAFQGDPSQGCSAVICNTNKGQVFFESITDAIIIERKLSELEYGQSSSLSHPIKEPESRSRFFKDAETMGYHDLALKYLTDKTVKGILKDYLPIPIQNKLKKLISYTNR